MKFLKKECQQIAIPPFRRESIASLVKGELVKMKMETEASAENQRKKK